MKLGGGDAKALSPDGKWVIAQRLEPAPSQFILLPTGAGESRALTHDDITDLAAAFLPDGKRFLFAGFKPGKPQRMWVQDLAGGAARPITPEGVVGLIVSPDGTSMVARGPGQDRCCTPLTGDLRELPRFDPDEGPVAFTPTEPCWCGGPGQTAWCKSRVSTSPRAHAHRFGRSARRRRSPRTWSAPGS